MKADRKLRLVLNKIYHRESLRGTDLRNLYFNCMDFAGMDLRQTNFEGARLSRGVLNGSDLSDANLSNADLTNANFRAANLTGAIFRNAIVAGANFADVKGLSTEVKGYLKSKGATGL
jgi:uncharacterized protein YjbI with pentapeptide repeats